MNNKIYALIQIDARKIAISEISVTEAKENIDKLSHYGKVTYFESLEQLALDAGINSKNENQKISKEVNLIIEYLTQYINNATKELKEEIFEYQQNFNIVKTKVNEFKKSLEELDKTNPKNL